MKQTAQFYKEIIFRCSIHCNIEKKMQDFFNDNVFARAKAGIVLPTGGGATGEAMQRKCVVNESLLSR